ncbi:hypothetical protein [Sphingomonas sanguinis]|uniref:hypothetical protein n=1 Tax=Sphingomonas sanguinis TaxID=33051 RepID=UPI001F4CBA39|nr:hypothetical protein [Sphingomonas sanguinis]
MRDLFVGEDRFQPDPRKLETAFRQITDGALGVERIWIGQGYIAAMAIIALAVNSCCDHGMIFMIALSSWAFRGHKRKRREGPMPPTPLKIPD